MVLRCRKGGTLPGFSQETTEINKGHFLAMIEDASGIEAGN